jgi:transcriptional antiterminator NusG
MADEDTQTQNDSVEEAPVGEEEVDAQNETNIEEPAIESPAEAEEVVDETEKASAKAETEEAETSSPESTVEAADALTDSGEDVKDETKTSDSEDDTDEAVKEDQPVTTPVVDDSPSSKGRWYVVHTFSGHENRVGATLKQRIESEHLDNLIFDILVPTQDKIEIRGGKKETVKEKIFPGYILVKMLLTDESWLAVRTTQGVTSFVGAGNKPTPISEAEVNSIVKFTTQGAMPTFKEVFMVDDTVKIIDGPFADFIGKVDSVDTEKGRVRVLVSIFGRETPVELDFLQVTKL